MNILPKPLKIDFIGGFCRFESCSRRISENMEQEEYTLQIHNNGKVQISGGSEKALFYADKTFEQIKFQYKDAVPVCYIHDKPKYKYRGFMIDCARHYFPIEELKKIIDAMSMFKFNIFHWHLTDDQGWRICLDEYPCLGDEASIRKYSNFGKLTENEPYGTAYTKEEMQEIVAFCAERFIDVVPEIDMPGHTSAFLSVFPQFTCSGNTVEVKTRQGIYKDVICPAKDEVYTVIDRIFSELTEIFPFDVYHIGGDEVPTDSWNSCADCKKLMKQNGIDNFADYHNYFMNKIIDCLSEKGKTCIVWNDTMQGNALDSRAVVQYWKEKDKRTINYANNKGRIILSPFSSYYMDYDYDITPLKRTYSFNPELKGLNSKGVQNIYGVETPVWTEYIRTSEQMQKMLFPRVLAVACTAWEHGDKNYQEFLKSATFAVEMLREKGIAHMPEKRWNYTCLAMPAGWLKFVGRNYTLDYIKSCLK